MKIDGTILLPVILFSLSVQQQRVGEGNLSNTPGVSPLFFSLVPLDQIPCCPTDHPGESRLMHSQATAAKYHMRFSPELYAKDGKRSLQRIPTPLLFQTFLYANFLLQNPDYRQRSRILILIFLEIFPKSSLSLQGGGQIDLCLRYFFSAFDLFFLLLTPPPPPFPSLACLCWGRVSMGGYFHIVSCLTFHNLPHQGSFETD